MFTKLDTPTVVGIGPFKPVKPVKHPVSTNPNSQANPVKPVKQIKLTLFDIPQVFWTVMMPVGPSSQHTEIPSHHHCKAMNEFHYSSYIICSHRKNKCSIEPKYVQQLKSHVCKNNDRDEIWIII